MCEAEVCVTPRETRGSALIADVEAPPRTVLRNAVFRVGATTGQPCQAGVPVSAVTIDDEAVAHGPLALAGAHRITVRFASDPATAGDPKPQHAVDLDLTIGGQVRCLRIPIKYPGGGS